MESGAETYRVEDTMNRIAASYGLDDTYSFVTSTAIIFSLNNRTIYRTIESLQCTIRTFNSNDYSVIIF